MSPMPDALSSASLLLAAIALVYSTWSHSIEAQATRTYSGELNTKIEEQKETQDVLNFRARPLMVVSWLVFVTFLPRSGGLLATAVSCAARSKMHCTYDDVAAIFLLTQLVIVGLALHLGGRVGKLKQQISL